MSHASIAARGGVFFASSIGIGSTLRYATRRHLLDTCRALQAVSYTIKGNVLLSVCCAISIERKKDMQRDRAFQHSLVYSLVVVTSVYCSGCAATFVIAQPRDGMAFLPFYNNNKTMLTRWARSLKKYRQVVLCLITKHNIIMVLISGLLCLRH
jgi:hypothetical protein